MKIRTEISRGGTHVKYTIIFNDNYELWRRPGLNVWLPEGLREETITIKTFTSAGVTGGGGKEFRLKNDLNLTNFKSPTRELLKPPHRGGNKANWDKFWTNVTSTGSGSEIATKWKDQNLLSFGLNSWENRSHNAYKWEIEADAKNGVVLSQLPILAGMENWDNGYPRYILSGPDETADTDGDGFPDKVEKAEGTDPNDPKSNPDTKDTDGDGFPDKVEKAEGTDPNDPKSNPDTKDTDGDGFPDVVEKDAGTDPNDKNSTPDNVDTDKDGFPDKEEVEKGTDPTKADTDGDGLTDKEEVEKGTDPTKADTDGDGFTDKEEVDKGTNPKDPNSKPESKPVDPSTKDTDSVKDPSVTSVKDPSNLTDAEKAKVAEEVKKSNPTAKDIKVNKDGSVVVTFEDGTTSVIPADKTVKKSDSSVAVNPATNQDSPAQAPAEKAGAKELPNTGTEQSSASLALALLAAATGGLLIAKKRKEEE
ncbi:LPXTG cell wall anchor domain-containing protein [Streptococcus pseudopneumoniae]|uniref:LPXTG cell wall anchor domain-containing protein n=1 Tax=Streptococcus pseudopneumoniae TaxID=257758 RepID=UPI00202F621C|nr:LPXTG cell wall anchor domain-containing protein [Streptococcus pseudopneumoniae]